MADILGWKIPQGGPKEVLAAVAVISIPVALVAGAGYGLYRTGKFLKERLAPETDEQLVARLERLHREGEVR